MSTQSDELATRQKCVSLSKRKSLSLRMIVFVLTQMIVPILIQGANRFNDADYHHQLTQHRSENMIRSDDDLSSAALRFGRAHSPSNRPELGIIPCSVRSAYRHITQSYRSPPSIPSIPTPSPSMQALFWHPVQSALDPQEPGRLSWECPPSSQMHIISGDLDLGGVYDLDIPMIRRHTFKRKHSIYCSPRGDA